MRGERVAILAPRSAIAGALMAQLQARGAYVAAIGREVEGLSTSAIAWRTACDLTDFDAVAEALAEAKKQLGGLTGMVNCSGSILL